MTYSWCEQGDYSYEPTDYPESYEPMSEDDSDCVNIKVTVGNGYFPNEISWYINDESCSGGADVEMYCCVPEDSTVVCQDSYGDGWNSAEMTINAEHYCGQNFGSFYSEDVHMTEYDGTDHEHESTHWDDESYGESSDEYSEESSMELTMENLYSMIQD